MRFLNRTIARPLPVIMAATILGLLVATVLLPTAPLRPAWNSLIVSATTAIASLAIGVPLAVLIFRTDLPGRRWLPAVFGMMLLVPLYLQAAGWDAAFGRQGWYAYQWSSLDSPWFSGRLAVVLIHAAASIPWTILLVGLGLQRVEPELEELALLEGRPIQVLWHVTLRRAATAIAVAAIWSMVTTASEMTVADMYQVRTYAEEMYVGFALGDSLSAVMIRLIPGLLITSAGVTAMCATMIPWKPHDRVMTIRSRREFPLGTFRWCAAIAVTLVILIIAGLPLASLVYKAGLVVEQSDGMRVRYWTASRFFQMLASVPRRYSDEFRGTAFLAATTATCVMLISICAAWWARRGGSRAVLLWVVIATAFALPGPLVSLAVVSILNHPTYDWLAYLYDRTIVAPVLALIVRTLPLPLLLTWLGFSTIPREQLEAARMEGASPLGECLHVAIPQRRRLLFGSWLLAALLAAGDLSASILVTPPGFFTLPTRIFGLVHAGVDDQVAALCLFALFTYAIVAGLILFSTRFRLE